MTNMTTTPGTGMSFWERREGKIGKWMGYALGGLGVVAFLHFGVLSLLISMMTSALSFTILAGTLGFLVYLITDKRNWTRLDYMAQSLIRMLVGQFIAVGPIAWMETYAANLRQKVADAKEKYRELRGQITVIQEQITERNQEIQRHLALAGRAKKENRPEALKLNAKKAGRRTNDNRDAQELLNVLVRAAKNLEQRIEHAESLAEDITDEVAQRRRKQKAMRSAHSVMQSLKGLFSGPTEEEALFEQATEVVADQYAQQLGELDDFFKTSERVVQTLDLENGMYEEEALQMLDELEQRGLPAPPTQNPVANGQTDPFARLLKAPEKESV